MHVNTAVFTARRYASAVMSSSCVRLSVCLSVTSQYCTKMTKHDHTNKALRQHKNSTFLTPNILAKFEWGHPIMWTSNKGGVG